MGGTTSQKLRLTYLVEILQKKTDEEHRMTMQELISELGNYGIKANRKTIYDDIELLRMIDVDIIGVQEGQSYFYYLGSREFELAELKLLVDSVQSAKFITEKKSNELIRKIESLTSEYNAKQLERQVYVSGRTKADNESIYYNVDKIHTAIASNAKICFQYFRWTVEKKQELRHNGKVYCISPWALSWDDENYYLVGYDTEADKIKHYRVDKMLHLEIVPYKREGKELFRKFDMAAYSKKVFGMFSGVEQKVKIRFENALAGVVIDRFGKDVTMFRTDEEHFTVLVDVAVSRQFLGWIIALGDGVTVLGPENVVEEMREIGKGLLEKYK